MNLEKSLMVRERVKNSLIDKPFFKERGDWQIRDVIVANSSNVKETYLYMWDNGISNEMAISLVENSDKDFDLFIITHQWSWGSGDLFFKKYIPDSDFI